MLENEINEEIEQLRRSSEATYYLALGLSLASRIDTGLIRKLRLDVAPKFFDIGFPVQCEARIWFGPWVSSRDDRGIRFRSDFANAFRDRLVGPTISPILDSDGNDFLGATRQLIESLHANIHPAFRLEESLIGISIQHRESREELEQQLKACLGSAVRAIQKPENQGLDSWLFRMSSRLPEAAQDTDAIAKFKAITEPKAASDRRTAQPLTMAANFDSLKKVVLDVRRSTDCFQIGYLVDGGYGGIEVPKMDPIVIDFESKATVAFPKQIPISESVFVLHDPHDLDPPHFVKRENRKSAKPNFPANLKTGQLLISDSNPVCEIPYDKVFEISLKTVDGKTYKLHESDALRRFGKPKSDEMQSQLYMDLSEQSLRAIPKEVFNNKYVQRLNLRGNQISRISEKLQGLPNLIHLDLSSNQISFLPSWVFELPKLESLMLDGNNIKHIEFNPKEDAPRYRLVTLSIRNNNLNSLPAELGKFSSLTSLHVEGNGLEKVPAVVRDSNEQILVWLRESNQQTRPNFKLPIFLLGGGAEYATQFIDGIRKSNDDSLARDSANRSLFVKTSFHEASVQQVEDELTELEFAVVNLTEDHFSKAQFKKLIGENAVVILFAGTPDDTKSKLAELKASESNATVLLVTKAEEFYDAQSWEQIQQLNERFHSIKHSVVIRDSQTPVLDQLLAGLGKVLSKDIFRDYAIEVLEEAEFVSNCEMGQADFVKYLDALGIEGKMRDQVRRVMAERFELLQFNVRAQRIYNNVTESPIYLHRPGFIIECLMKVLGRELVEKRNSPWIHEGDLESARLNLDAKKRDLMLIAGEQLDLISVANTIGNSAEKRMDIALINSLLPVEPTKAIGEFVRMKTDNFRQLRYSVGKETRLGHLGPFAARFTDYQNENVTKSAVLLSADGEQLEGAGQVLVKLSSDSPMPYVQITAKGHHTNSLFIEAYRGISTLLEDLWQREAFELFVSCPNAMSNGCEGEFLVNDFFDDPGDIQSEVKCDSCDTVFDVIDVAQFLEIDYKFPTRDEERLLKKISKVPPVLFVYSKDWTRGVNSTYQQIVDLLKQSDLTIESNLEHKGESDPFSHLADAEAIVVLSDKKPSKLKDEKLDEGALVRVENEAVPLLVHSAATSDIQPPVQFGKQIADRFVSMTSNDDTSDWQLPDVSQQQLLAQLFDEQKTLDLLFLSRFREGSSIEEDLPAFWGLEAAAGFNSLSRTPPKQHWIVSFYCECPGHFHPVEEGRELLQFDRADWMSLPKYASWILNRFRIRILLNRKYKPSRPSGTRTVSICRHLEVFEHLASLPDDRLDPEEGYSPATELYDAFRYDMRPMSNAEPKFGGLVRQLQQDGTYLWLCKEHLS